MFINYLQFIIVITFTKCYFVQVIDEEGNTLDCDYVFTDKLTADYVAKQMKKELIENEKDRDTKAD